MSWLLLMLVALHLSLPFSAQMDYGDDYDGDYSYGDDEEDRPKSTECGATFLSSQRANGTFTSPYYPNSYPRDMECRYIFRGHGRERVQITFIDFDLNYPAGDPLNPIDCGDVDNLIVYEKEGGSMIAEYCGNKRPPRVMSSGNDMEIVFSSETESMTKGFNATYRFVEDFGITTGEQDTSMVCGFTYKSDNAPNGTFMSPNYPGLYPRDTECHYLFYGRGKETKVLIKFAFFAVEGVPPACSEESQSDYVEFSNFNVELKDRKMNRLCGTNLENNEKASDGSFFRVSFKSNNIYDDMGFQAYYQFTTKPESESHNRLTDPTNGSSAPRRQSLFLPTTIIAIVIAIWSSSSSAVGYRTL